MLELRPRFAVLAQREAAARGGGGSSGGGGTGGGGGGGEGNDEGDDDNEAAKGMARLFAEIGEAYTALIATGAPGHQWRCDVLKLAPGTAVSGCPHGQAGGPSQEAPLGPHLVCTGLCSVRTCSAV